MSLRYLPLAAAMLLLTGCAPSTPIAQRIPAPQETIQKPAEHGSPSPTTSPTAKSNPTLDAFLGHMATTCLFAQGVGVAESVVIDGSLDGSMILLPPREAILDGYTAGWIPANGAPAEVVMESDAFESCAIANMDTLAKEAGQSLAGTISVTYDKITQVFTATVDFGGFSRTGKYQVGDGGIVYSVTSTDPQGRQIVTTMKFGMPKPDMVAALATAVKALTANQ